MNSLYRSLPFLATFSGQVPASFVSALLLLLPAGAAMAQAPIITGVLPAANARAATRTGPVTATFSQPLTPASAAALKIFSSQRGGLRTTATPAVVSGSTLSFTPASYPFMPGETMQLTLTQAAASNNGPLTVPRVQQFTAAVEGTGRGAFGAGSTAALVTSSAPPSVVLGDIDGDGDLDAMVPNQFLNSVSILLNDGTGTFAPPVANATAETGEMPYGLALGDVDGDGDLDFVTTNYNNNGGNSSVRINNGSGVFTAPAVGAEVAVRFSQRALALADLDGDGDLDLLSGSSVRLNNGAGLFTAPANAEITGVSSGLPGFAVGDLDNDGALDVVIASTSGNRVELRFNNGAGIFMARPAMSSLAVGDDSRALALGDVDGDGDLDLLVGHNLSAGSVGLFLNNGAGLFGAETQVMIASTSVTRSIALGDIDADGDLDLLTPIGGGRVSVRINNGVGVFSSPAANAEVAAGTSLTGISLGDLDADGDLDFVVASLGSITSRLNQPVTLASAAARATPAFALYPNPARTAATVAGVAPRATIEVLDALGRRVATGTADATGAAQLVLPAGLVPGVYVVRAGAQVQRLLVE